MSNDRTTNRSEMEVNKQAYNNKTNNEGKYGGGAVGINVDNKGDLILLDDVSINSRDGIKEYLVRTDVDTTNLKYNTSDLQTHSTYSGLDIMTNSVCSGFKVSIEK